MKEIMKKVPIVLLVMLIFSCNSSKESENTENADMPDSDIIENGNDTDGVVPACGDEWEQTELIEDVSTMFDFEIVTKEGTWKFEKDGDYEKLVVDRNFSPFHISEDGTIFADGYGGTNEIDGGVSFLQMLKPDGTLIEYVAEFEKDKDKELSIGMTKIDVHLAAMASYDEVTENIYVTMNMRSKIKNEITGEYLIKPFVAVIDKSGEISHNSWKFDANSICSAPQLEDGKIFISCINWIGVEELYIQSGRSNAEIIVIDGKTVYRKTFFTELEDFTVSFSSDNEKNYSCYREFGNYGLTIYEIGKENLCFEKKDYAEYFLTDYFDIKHKPVVDSFIKNSEYLAITVFYQEWISGDSMTWTSNKSGLYLSYENKEFLVSFMNDEIPKRHGEQVVYKEVFPGTTISDGKLIYLTGFSTFDMEDKGRDWITEEILAVSAQPQQPFIAVVNTETMEVHVRQFFTKFNENMPGLIYVKGEYIYYENHGFVTGIRGEMVRTLYRVPKSWLINEDAVAKDTRVWVEEREFLKELKPVMELSAGSYHACNLDEESKAICWGQNSSGQLGSSAGEIDEENESRITSPYPDVIEMNGELKGKKIAKISSGTRHTCVVTDLGAVYCWGENGFKQLGYGGGSSMYPKAVNADGVLKGKNMTAVSLGVGHTCAIDDEGKGYCWGGNSAGQLGCDECKTGLNDHHKPVAVDMTGALKDRKIIEISSGSGHTCVVADDDGAYCWGANDRGQLGDGEEGTQSGVVNAGNFSKIPVKVKTSGGKYVKVSAGYEHTCLLNSKGKIYCFGNNENGQLGDGTTEMRLTPVALNSDKVFKSVSAGFDHTCAVDDKDEAYCWGGNILGQLGTGDKESSLTPIKVNYETETKVKSISCGQRYTCSLTVEGKVHCWGWNDSGQLGNGTYENSLIPVEINIKQTGRPLYP
ncbi:MAG: RCC1 domain-containing protein [bacterium]